MISEDGGIMESDFEDQEIGESAHPIEVMKFLSEAQKRLEHVTSTNQSNKRRDEQGLQATEDITRLNLEQSQLQKNSEKKHSTFIIWECDNLNGCSPVEPN